MRIVGLDLSLTASGVATEEGTVTLKTKLRDVPRLVELRRQVLEAIGSADLVVIEDYAFSRADSHAHAIGEFGGVVRVALWEDGIPFALVGPTVLKKFAAGKGNAHKDEMIAAAIRRWGFEGTSNNEADAWLLRCMGLAQFVGLATAPTKAQTEALEKVDWPVIQEALPV